MPELKIGHGYDVHRLAEGRDLILGGIKIEHTKGLLGHSDADVLAHALMDALLGALRAGDIGQLFPDTDPAYEGADSMVLLSHVMQLIRDKGFELVDCDCTVAAQVPKLLPYREAMRNRMAEVMGVTPDKVGVKATTTEGLGFVGQQEGIAAWAVVLLGRSV
ncbi:2-C-methyl-D-erythritol 2,4-cyclodiphosphate synthase [Lancefieldella parvula]|uniref:2-C-methyl-D-erythritol 2,4-cyclodiphosphate synthase n=1 Tax=Lancefieldella parvula TaxID=1382 RepID=UPI0028E33938|nr:2-C-methyl-D-erythritol 2,4-cyclodiphosphate synthase [Lancefieldella parvula]